MRIYSIVIATVGIALASTSVDLGACGDKFFRPGQSAKVKGYAALHRASILVYKPVKPNREGVKYFETLLKSAGHKPVFVNHGSPLAQVVAAGKYDLVVVQDADVAASKAQLQSIPAGPDILPMVSKASNAVAAQVEKEHQFLIKPGMTPYDALDQIELAMVRRLKAASAARSGNGS
jgi:hypothetical protein